MTQFLTSAETELPLTMAITGDWGSGKSSLMNYLFANLKRRGLRPVWFNAWHYQNEPNVLISIIAKIHKHAIDPWWHPAGFFLRLKLVWRRNALWKLSFLCYLFAIVYLIVSILNITHKEWNDAWRYVLYQAKIEQPVMLSQKGFEHLCASWQAQYADKSQINLHNNHKDVFEFKLCEVLQSIYSNERIYFHVNSCATKTITEDKFSNITCFANPKVLLDAIENRIGKVSVAEEKELIDTLDFLRPNFPSFSLIAPLILFLFPVYFVTKSMRLLQLTSAEPLQTILKQIGLFNESSKEVDARLLIESNLSHITSLLGRRRIVLFIEDLDKCNKDCVRRVLEESNFLSSSCEIFIVIGMVPKYVMAKLVSSFDGDIAKALFEEEMLNGKTPPDHVPNAGQSWFAWSYLQKLINIEVPVPKPDAGQVKALLKNEAQSQAQGVDRKLEQLEKSEKRFDDALKLFGRLFRIALLLGVTGYAIYLAGWGLDGKTATLPVKEQVQSPATVSPKATDDAGQTQDLPKEKSPDTKDETGGTKGEIFIPAPSRDESFVTWPLWVGISAVMFLVLLVAVGQLIREQETLSDQRWWWLKPLLKWLKVTLFGPEVMQVTDDSAAALDIWHKLIALKDPTPRYIKSFRNQLRYFALRDDGALGREVQLVALATLHYVYPKDFDEILVAMETHFVSNNPWPVHFSEYWSDLVKALEEHEKKFGRVPSRGDIEFFKRMIQDIQIHRPH